MAKRFTDSGKWDKEKFSQLSAKLKLAWIYLCDKCDHAGVWDVNIRLMSFQVGESYTLEELIEGLGENVELRGSKIFIPAFIEFQYGDLNPTNRVHQSVIQRLDKLAPSKPHASPFQGAKDKDKDKDKEKEKEEGGVGETNVRSFPVTSGEVSTCVDEWRTTLQHFEINRPIGERDQVSIARAIQAFGAEWVKLAFAGARKQTKGRNFDPKNFVSLSLYLHKDKIERLVNIGAGTESSEGLDWSGFWDNKSGGAA